MATDYSYNLVAENRYSTVVAKYPPENVGKVREKRAEYYQSEAALETAFIEQLKIQGYEYLPITNEDALKTNLRTQLEKLNNFNFNNKEWEQFFTSELANPNQSIAEKTITIQEDYIKNLRLENGTVKNIYLLDKQSIHNNSLQVINQYATDEGKRANRYDVTVLVNGLPMVHIELKRRGVAITEAFNQINRYQRESFWADSGLFEYVQLFVISNGTHSKYYSNTTRARHIKESGTTKSKQGKKSSNSFEFTSWWADAANKPITELMDFAKTFFAKHSLLNILIRYCVFTSEQDLLAMRPYQIVATERILNRIEVSTNYKKLGNLEAGGYIWHTTGSGKTLTSYKAAQLASKLPDIDKVLFVVDRKDLDYQTMCEYDKFEKGAANSNTSTSVLKRQLEDSNTNIIITIIQKLDRFIKKNRGHKIFRDHMVIIFDECHRSQFGDMHSGITKTFKNYHLFGFTGTPIFAVNASSGGCPDLKTTEQAFGDKLHTYTIVDAISDKNVLPFKVDYISTMREEENIEDKEISSIDSEAALASKERLSNIVAYIREHFDQKTKRISFYKIKDRRLADYNQMFGTSYDTSSDKFQNYYKDVSERVKNREVDILIVVNMFLTGFDATTLNTLWVDKNMRLHGLLQAYSRTNRILNSVKSFVNIVCFRNLEEATNKSIALFGDKEAGGVVLLKSYDEYYNGYKNEDKEIRGYKSLIDELLEKFPWVSQSSANKIKRILSSSMVQFCGCVIF